MNMWNLAAGIKTRTTPTHASHQVIYCFSSRLKNSLLCPEKRKELKLLISHESRHLEMSWSFTRHLIKQASTQMYSLFSNRNDTVIMISDVTVENDLKCCRICISDIRSLINWFTSIGGIWISVSVWMGDSFSDSPKNKIVKIMKYNVYNGNTVY